MSVLSKRELDELLPHRGAMCLLDGVESWDRDKIRCFARSHCDPTNPLREAGALHIVAGLEYAAQAVGVHMGLVEGKRSGGPLVGVIGGVRDVVFALHRLDVCAEDLFIEAVRLFGDGRGVLYRFVVSSAGRELVSGRLSVFLETAPE